MTTSTPSRPASRPAPPQVTPPAHVAPVWVDGVLSDVAGACVGALDHGLVVGDGVFETCKVVGGAPFALTIHLQRLARSAAGLGLPAPDEALVRSAVAEVVAALAGGWSGTGAGGAGGEGPAPARLRITWTAGPGPLGSDRTPGAPGTLVVAASPAPAPDPAPRAVTVAWTRNERSAVAGLKTTSYAENVVALAAARARGAGEALLANTRGEVCEGTGSNVLVRVGDELVTPPLSSGALAGTTRRLLLAWAAQEGLPVRERVLAWEELTGAQEVLLTSSLRDVQPLAALDDRPLATGDLARAAVELYARRSAEDADPVPDLP